MKSFSTSAGGRIAAVTRAECHGYSSTMSVSFMVAVSSPSQLRVKTRRLRK